MRDKNLDFIQFSDQIERYLKKKTYSIEILRRAVVDSPTLLSEDFQVKFLFKKLINLRGLAIISYYLPENLGWKIREYLEERARKLNFKDKLKLELLLTSKNNTLLYLYETQEFSSHEIFGNLLGRGLQSLNTMKILKRKHIVKKPQRRRGYNDKGSLRSSDRWLPISDSTLTELQNEKEKKTDLYIRTKLFLERYLSKKVFFETEKYLQEKELSNVEGTEVNLNLKETKEK